MLWGFFLMVLVSMLRTGFYVKEMKSIQFFNPSWVIHMRAQVNSSTIANICRLIQTFKYQYCGFKVHFKLILVYNLKTKSNFWSKYPHYIMGCMINLGSMFFLFLLVLNLAYIEYPLCHIWSVYMQYLRCCDHYDKCLFPITQQAEVLLNFFGECINITLWLTQSHISVKNCKLYCKLSSNWWYHLNQSIEFLNVLFYLSLPAQIYGHFPKAYTP